MTVFEQHNAIEAALRPSNMDVYAIYLRKSRADVEAEKLGEGETLARHKKILTELAARKGLYVGEIYQEIVSGETIEARPEIQRLINDCYAGKYRGIIIIEVTRLSRGSSGDAQIIMDCLRFGNKNNGILVVTPTKVYDVAHNIAKMETHKVYNREEDLLVHRKGATRAFGPGREEVPEKYRAVGQPVLIPGTMGTSSYVLHGTETAMEETFGSTAHGAGRVLSRSRAKKDYDADEITSDLESKGIKIINTPGVTYNSYGNDIVRGARMITVKESDPWSFETELITISQFALDNSDFAEDAEIVSVSTVHPVTVLLYWKTPSSKSKTSLSNFGRL